MTLHQSSSLHRLNHRRKAIGMSVAIVAARTGLSQASAKRILGGQAARSSFANVAAVAHALGVSFEFGETDIDEFRAAQARKKAEQVARLVQGTSALEAQAVDPQTYQRLVERSFHELLAGSNRRLWAA